MTWSALAFAVLAGLILLGGYKVVVAPYVTHAALFLALVLVSIAGLFVLLQAPFLAAVQVLVYAGAVMAVVIFAIMLSELKELGGERSPMRGLAAELRESLRSPYLGLLPVVTAGLLAAMVLVAISRLAPAGPAAAAAPDSSVIDLGRLLFTDYLVPFEIASAVLLVAMIGAIVLAREGGAS